MTLPPPDPENAPFDPSSMPTTSLSAMRAPWYRRPWFLVAVAIVAIVGLSVVMDLPQKLTVAEDAANQDAILKEVNNDILPCTYATQEAFSFYTKDVRGQLTTSDLSQVPKLLIGDQTACSFASGNVYDLTNNVTTTRTPAGKDINAMMPIVVSWTTDNALAAIEDIQRLFTTPGVSRTLRDLGNQQNQLQLKRKSALALLASAERTLGRKLIALKLPTLARLPGT